jgi:uncharacterized NAD(P)/FAD-binding protein YdhS
MSSGPSIAIIGGGCSGALAALHLLRSQRPARIHLIEPRSIAGTGLAYSTDCPQHLLNVPARCIGVSSSAPQDFLEWLSDDNGAPADPEAFIARARFGRYIADRLEATRREARPHSILQRHCAEALDVTREGERAVIHLNDWTRLEADCVVLALGNPPPRHLSFFPHAEANPIFYESAWSPGALAVPDPHSEVVLIGSGLTAVDALVGLRANGHQGVVRMISRRGLLPNQHVSFKKNTGLAAPWKPGTLRELVREVRKRVIAAEEAGSDWREVIDSLRRVTNEAWASLTPDDRERFYRHVKTYWDVHRHRMAPQVATMIGDERRSGSLQVHAGRIQRITQGADALRIEILLRPQKTASFCAQRIINCTGSEQDYSRVDSELLRSLFGKGWLQVNPPGLGVRTVENGAVMDCDGAVIPWLHAIGPMRIGGLLETTAVPEIREQAAALAETLLGGHSAVAARVRQPAPVKAAWIGSRRTAAGAWSLLETP